MLQLLIYSSTLDKETRRWGGTDRPRDDRSIDNVVSMPGLITEPWEVMYATSRLHGDHHI